MSDPRLFLVDILERARRIRGYVSEGREEFDSSQMVQDAVLRNLEVIGEAAKGLSEEERSRWPRVPWRRMAGLRDILIHAYRDVDLDAVWEICDREIPRILPQLEAILRELGVDPEEIP